MGNIKFKKILKEAAWDHTSGKALPTLDDVQKAYEAKKHLREEYVESMNLPELEKHLNGIKKLWLKWKKGPMTYYDDVPPAYKELEKFIAKWIKKNIR